MKLRLVLLASYFILTPFFILTLIIYQVYLYHQNSSVSGKITSTAQTKIAYRTLPDTPHSTTVALSAHEARVDVLKEFFTRYGSPLSSYAKNIVDAADKYKLDYRLLPAIAMQESTLCRKMPKNSNNCWGFGIYGKKITRFDNLADAIETISKTLSRDYHGQGLKNPAEIMTKYTPSSNGSWATNVSYVMDRIALAL